MANLAEELKDQQTGVFNLIENQQFVPFPDHGPFVQPHTFETQLANENINALVAQGFSPVQPSLRDPRIGRDAATVAGTELRPFASAQPASFTAALTGAAPQATPAQFQGAAIAPTTNAAPGFSGSVAQTGFGGFQGANVAPAATAQAGQFSAALAGPAAQAQAANVGAQNAALVNRGQVRDVNLNGVGETHINRFMNPFTQQVTDTVTRDLEKARDRALAASESQAIASGAFGGSRNAVAASEINREFGDTLARTLAQLNSQGFDTALNAAFTQQGRDLQAQGLNQGVDTQTALSNQNARNLFGQLGAQFEQDTNLANARAVNDRDALNAGFRNEANRRNAELLTQTNLANADAINTQNTFTAQLAQAANQRNAELGLQAGLANTDATNRARELAADRLQQANLFNAESANERAFRQAGLDQDAGLRNAGFRQDAELANLNVGRDFSLADLANRQDAARTSAGFAQDANLFSADAENVANQANQDALNTAALQDAAFRDRALSESFAGFLDADAANQRATNEASFFNAQLPLQEAQLVAQQRAFGDTDRQFGQIGENQLYENFLAQRAFERDRVDQFTRLIAAANGVPSNPSGFERALGAISTGVAAGFGF